MTGAERALARVDEGAIERNCRRLLELTGGSAELCAVVKADGYGHGAAEAAAAALRGGAGWLAVATAGEAAALREQGLDGRLLVMGALTGADLATAVDAGADVDDPGVDDFEEEEHAASAPTSNTMPIPRARTDIRILLFSPRGLSMGRGS